MRIVPWLLVAAVAATPTPAPVALQYDEISRIIVAPATPPAPGTFADDYKLAMSARPAQVSGSSSIETPALKTHGIVGAGAELIPGEPGGSNTSDSLSEAGSGQAASGGTASRANLMRNGRLIRYTFYFTKGWIREDDPVAQSAAISKCDEHVFIMLNLAKKTYVQTDGGARGSDCFQMPGTAGNSKPGSEDLTIDATSQALGSKTIDGVATTGTSENVTMNAANATGSCQNGQLSLSRITYVSDIQKQRAYCPLAYAPAVATDAAQFASLGGCAPTLRGNAASTDGTKLEMYLLMNTAPPPGGRAIGMLTERGHVTVLDATAADPLFEVPAGFTAAR